MAISTPPSIAADAVDSATLVARLARPLPAATPFQELRFSTMLTEPVVVRGVLEIAVNGQLLRRVAQPFVETTTINRNRVLIDRDGKQRQFSLQRAPELEALLAAFRALVGGDSAGLEAGFNVRLEGDDRGWRLSLTPRNPRLARRIKSILVTGAAAEPHCLTLADAGRSASVLLLGTLATRELPQGVTRDSLDAICTGS